MRQHHRTHHLKPHGALPTSPTLPTPAPPAPLAPPAPVTEAFAPHLPRLHPRLSQGLRTVDLGAACWSMHSIRETVGVADIDNSLVLFRTFFSSFAELDQKCLFGPPKVCPPCRAPPKA